MRNNHETLFSHSLTETESNTQYDVVIVGAGLSGLTLASELPEYLRVLVLDSRKAEYQTKGAMYLVSEAIAHTWGFASDPKYTERKRKQSLINGVISYNSKGIIQYQVPVSDREYGFTAIPQGYLESTLKQKVNAPIAYDTRCSSIEVSSPILKVKTNHGDIRTHLVIDATGWPGSLVHDYYKKPEDFLLITLFGGNYQYSGFDSRSLTFARGFPRNNVNWCLPINSDAMEVMAGFINNYSGSREWWASEAEREFDMLVKFHTSHNRKIYTDKKPKYPWAFRVQPIERSFYSGNVIPFGEAGGLNSSTHGQLIDVLPYYAQRMSKLIIEANNNEKWSDIGLKFYSDFLRHPPYFYLIHSLNRENKRTGVGNNANQLLKNVVQQTFDRDTLWRILENNGLKMEQVKQLFMKQPTLMVEYVFKSSPALLSLLMHEPQLYIQLLFGFRNRILAKLPR